MSWPWNPVQRSLKVIESGTIRYGFPLVFYSNFVHNTRRFWDIRFVTIQWPWNPGYVSLKGIGTDTYRSATFDFLLTFHSNHGPISYRFRDKRRFQWKIAKNFPPTCILSPRWTGFPWNWVSALEVKKTRMMGLLGRVRSLTISLAVWIQYTNVSDRQTDGQTPGDSKGRVYA